MSQTLYYVERMHLTKGGIQKVNLLSDVAVVMKEGGDLRECCADLLVSLLLTGVDIFIRKDTGM
jgi:hypothetical protein